MLRIVLCGSPDRQLPAQMAQPREGERMFLVDEEAARLLPVETGAAASEPPPNPKKRS
jgi:hypothetical protein